MYRGSIYTRYPQYRALRCHWENVYLYDDTLSTDRHLILRHRRMRRSLLLMLTALIIFVPSMLGCFIYRIRGLDDFGRLFGFGQPPASTNAYNDRVGRAVEPHAHWTQHGHRWQSPHRCLRLFSAHYRHEIGSSSEPVVRALALATTEFIDSCTVQARIVYRDYPNSLPAGPVTCRRLSRSSEGGQPNASEHLHDAILEFATGQPSNRVPVALSIQSSQDRKSVVWIPVNTSFAGPLRHGDSVGICIRAESGSPDVVTNVAEWYRSVGARQVTVYGVASRRSSAVVKAPSFRVEFVSWYDREMLAGASDITVMSLMLRDCALRSSATSKCVALLGVDERLVTEAQGSRSKGSMRDPRLLRVCQNSWAAFVEHRDGGSPCGGFIPDYSASSGSGRSGHHSPATAFRRCVNGAALEAILFRVDDGLLDGSTAVDKSASFLPPSIGILRHFASTAITGLTNSSEIIEDSTRL
ncbi:hypothetical protein HPB50_018357 [Hyalomma asiaticum]|uniref:Uncharacterized protein n=1 Tax=Hyalomma asiaticum TaxID=266040 RepID=A0ACB7T3F7_HYAAI|nr:hypothetical protein HPB50_018357 [Hyalomma asiaticum]